MDTFNLGDDLHQMGGDLHQTQLDLDFLCSESLSHRLLDYVSEQNNSVTDSLMKDFLYEIKRAIRPPLSDAQFLSLYNNYFYDDELFSQSGSITSSVVPAGDTNSHDIYSQPLEGMQDLVSSSADLGEFLSRPVRLRSFTWSVGSSISAGFYPWILFFADDAVKRKTANYSLVKGNMELTFYVNGTPFHSGMILASHLYGVTNHATSSVVDGSLITQSQRPHIYLNASTNKNGCLCIPFFYPLPMISTNSPSPPVNQLGYINVTSIRPLAQINAGSDDVTISVFARLVDYQFAAPTNESLVSMSGLDESSSKGPVSTIASAVADAAGMLSSVPVIGPFALATHIGATAASAIARLFGYSRPVIIDKITLVKNHPLASLSLSDQPDTSQKLSITSKQELSLDPRTVGLPAVDQLSIESFVKRESFRGVLTWPVTALQDALIGSIAITPMNEPQEIRTDPDSGTFYAIAPTSLSYISRMFNYWTGTIHLRFQVIGTQFHRGKLAVVYEPNNTAPTSDWYNTNFITIIDLSEGRDFTCSFNWQQAAQYAPIDRVNPNPTIGATGVIGNDSCNGVVHLYVVNELVTPDAVTPVQVMVSISGGDDFQLMDPTSANDTLTFANPIDTYPPPTFAAEELVAQSAVEITPDMENAPEQENIMVTTTTDINIDNSNNSLMYFGERVTSIRQLLKRYNYYTSIGQTRSNAYTERIYSMWAYPIGPGQDPNGIHISSFGNAMNFVGLTHLDYFRRAFNGWKGSIRYKVLPKYGNLNSMTVVRIQDNETLDQGFPFNVGSSFITASPSASTIAAGGNQSRGFGTGGMAMTVNDTMDSLEFEIPYALPTRYSGCGVSANATIADSLINAYPQGNRVNLILTCEETGVTPVVDLYVGTGEDFSYYGFIGAPHLYLVNTPRLPQI